MKIKIEYEFKVGNSFPYIAYTQINGNYTCKISKVSFEEAKNELLEHLRGLDLEEKEAPEPEEIEL